MISLDSHFEGALSSSVLSKLTESVGHNLQVKTKYNKLMCKAIAPTDFESVEEN